MNWVLVEFLYYAFRIKDDDGNKRHQSRQHAKLASSFLQGLTQYTPAMIIYGTKNCAVVMEITAYIVYYRNTMLKLVM